MDTGAVPPSPSAEGPGPAAPAPSVWERFRHAYAEAPVTVSIVVLTVAVWLAHEAILHVAGVNTDLTLGDPGTGIHGDWWRLVTPLVVHFGLLHLGLNMVVLWRLGPAVERVVGRPVYLASYLLAGIGGQVASDLWYQPTVVDGVIVRVLSGGASGAIYGVLGILVGYYLGALLARRSGRLPARGWQLNPKAVRSLAIQAGVWLVIAGPLFHVDSAAHAGGAVVGLAVGAVVAYRHTEPVEPAPPAGATTPG